MAEFFASLADRVLFVGRQFGESVYQGFWAAADNTAVAHRSKTNAQTLAQHLPTSNYSRSCTPDQLTRYQNSVLYPSSLSTSSHCSCFQGGLGSAGLVRGGFKQRDNGLPKNGNIL